MVVNTALLQLAGYTPPAQPYHPPCIHALPEKDRQAYDITVRCMEQLAVYLKYCSNPNNNLAGSRLSRPMQRKLVTLLQCTLTDEEGRGKAVRAARSLGERTVTELILQHQNPQQLSANLWAAVRARGCQFLGPAMQEEVLKLVLLALEDGSALSRKVLVMFVVQRLEPHFPQASKTSIGHVVQLLYRASCFKVSKRECDSSLMQLKEEFRTYESLRREHDAQIVQIATEAGLRIAPDQWSALLYGDTAHKSHMQSIIDKLQTPQSFAQSVQELFIALQRTGDPAQLVLMGVPLERLASIDTSPDAKIPTWQQLADVMTSLQEVVTGLIHYLQQQASGRDANHNQKPVFQDRCMDQSPSQTSPLTAGSTPTHRYKTSLCRDSAARASCPRGNACTFIHSDDEISDSTKMSTQNTWTNGKRMSGYPIAPRFNNCRVVQNMNQRYPHPPMPTYRPPFSGRNIQNSHPHAANPQATFRPIMQSTGVPYQLRPGVHVPLPQGHRYPQHQQQLQQQQPPLTQQQLMIPEYNSYVLPPARDHASMMAARGPIMPMNLDPISNQHREYETVWLTGQPLINSSSNNNLSMPHVSGIRPAPNVIAPPQHSPMQSQMPIDYSGNNQNPMYMFRTGSRYFPNQAPPAHEEDLHFQFAYNDTWVYNNNQPDNTNRPYENRFSVTSNAESTIQEHRNTRPVIFNFVEMPTHQLPNETNGASWQPFDNSIFDEHYNALSKNEKAAKNAPENALANNENAGRHDDWRIVGVGARDQRQEDDAESVSSDDRELEQGLLALVDRFNTEYKGPE